MDEQTKALQEFGQFRLDLRKKILWRENELLTLPPKAVELLCVLIENKGEVVSKDELLQTVWHDSFVEESNLTHHIYELRKTFKELGCRENLIQTVPRRGYCFAGETAEIFEREETVIERRAFAQTLIEEVSDVVDFAPNESESAEKISPRVLSSAESSKQKKNFGRHSLARLLSPSPAWTGVLAGLILVAGFFVWQTKQGSARGNLTEVRSIAVLPLKSFEQNAFDDESLPLRMTDSLITKLGKLNSIAVRPTDSVRSFAKEETNALEAGRKLNVDAVLDGRIQREGERLRVTLQLVSVNSGEQIWSEQFDGRADQLLNFQDAIAAKLLNKINLSLTPEQKAAFTDHPTENTEAFENYLKGNFFRRKRTPEGLRTAVSFYEKAIAADPNFAEAFAGSADSQYLLADFSCEAASPNVAAAKSNLLRALALKPNLAEAYVTLGLIETNYEWDWKRAEQSLLKAVELAPNSPDAHHRYAMLLLKLRRFAPAEAAMRRAKELDPLSPGVNMNLGTILFYSKQFDRAIEQFQKTIELDAQFAAPRWHLARCHWARGDKKSALAVYVGVLRKSGDAALAEQVERQAKALSVPEKIVGSWAENWRARVDGKSVNEHDLAVLSAMQGKTEETLQWLEKTVGSRHVWSASINAEPEFDFVRDDPRFQAILRKINL